MTVREFIRGGYKTLSEVTVVSNHGRPVFTVFPYHETTGRQVVRVPLRDNSSTLSRNRDLSSEKKTW